MSKGKISSRITTHKRLRKLILFLARASTKSMKKLENTSKMEDLGLKG